MANTDLKIIEVEQILNLQDPWYIKSNELKMTQDHKLERHIRISYKKGTKFPDTEGKLCSVMGTKDKTWQHYSVEEWPCYVDYKMPKIKTTNGKFEYINTAPWARPTSRFTWIFEAHVMQKIQNGDTFDSIGQALDKESNLIWRIFNGWINIAYAHDIIDPILSTIGLAEISSGTNHKVTIAIDLKHERVLRVMPNQGKKALSDLKTYLTSKGIAPHQIKHISGPLSLQCAKDAEYYFPQAQYHVDPFYITEALNNAMDQVRKQERGEDKKKLTENQTLFLMPRASLSEEQEALVLDLMTQFPNVGRAYKIKEGFLKLWEQPSTGASQDFLEQWCAALLGTRKLEPFKELAKTYIEYGLYLTNFHTLPTNPQALDQVHKKIIAALKRTKGLTNIENASNMIYFHAGKLTMPYPLPLIINDRKDDKIA